MSHTSIEQYRSKSLQTVTSNSTLNTKWTNEKVKLTAVKNHLISSQSSKQFMAQFH